MKAAVELAAAVPALKELAGIEPTIKKMADQFERNGGATIRDDLDKVLENSTTMLNELHDHVKNDEKRFKALEAH